MISLVKTIRIFLGIILLGGIISTSNAIDGENSAKNKISMDEVARQIRQYKSWQILDATPRQKESGYQYFRFKLLRNDGKVKIIKIDPNNPNLRRLEN